MKPLPPLAKKKETSTVINAARRPPPQWTTHQAVEQGSYRLLLAEKRPEANLAAIPHLPVRVEVQEARQRALIRRPRIVVVEGKTAPRTCQKSSVKRYGGQVG